jgi:hypothetical protein
VILSQHVAAQKVSNLAAGAKSENAIVRSNNRHFGTSDRSKTRENKVRRD